MYVTRPLSLYRSDPSALFLQPPEGPNSGVLVIQDEEPQPTCWFGICESNQLSDMPFPRNENLYAWYVVRDGQTAYHFDNPVIFIPVLDQPLSSNHYYVIQSQGKHIGKAHINSKGEDKTTCCFFSCMPDKKPEPFDKNDIYQRFEICRKGRNRYVAKSIAADGYPPHFLRVSGWGVGTSGKPEFLPNEAPGLDAKLRRRLLEFDFPLSATNSRCVEVGKWYTPFMFIQEAGSLKNQVNDSRYYEVTLDQRWEKIFEYVFLSFQRSKYVLNLSNG